MKTSRVVPLPLPVDVEEVHQELDGAALEEHCEDNHGQPEKNDENVPRLLRLLFIPFIHHTWSLRTSASAELRLD